MVLKVIDPGLLLTLVDPLSIPYLHRVWICCVALCLQAVAVLPLELIVSSRWGNWPVFQLSCQMSTELHRFHQTLVSLLNLEMVDGLVRNVFREMQSTAKRRTAFHFVLSIIFLFFPLCFWERGTPLSLHFNHSKVGVKCCNSFVACNWSFASKDQDLRQL